MNERKKEELGYLVLFTIGIIHLYLVLIFALVGPGGERVSFTGTIRYLVIISAVMTIFGGFFYYTAKKGFSLLSRLGVIDPSEDVDEFGYAKCGRCGSRVSPSAYICTKCGSKFRYDREDYFFLFIFIFGILLLYWIMISDFIVGKSTIDFNANDRYLMTVALVVTGIGIIPFAFKRAGFSTVALLVPGKGGAFAQEGVGKMQIVGGRMSIDVSSGQAGDLFRGAGSGAFVPGLDLSDPNQLRQFQMESKLRELEMRQRMEEEIRGLKSKLEMEMKKKERFRQMLSESRLDEMELRQQVEEAQTTTKTMVPSAAPGAPGGEAEVIPMPSMAKSKTKRLLFPFTSIVGQDIMKRALLLNAINPEIGGVLIRGQKGTGKSVSIRGLAEILPHIEVVKGCRFSCDPSEPEKFCWECEAKLEKGDIQLEDRPIRVVDLPLNTTEDRLVGSIDLEKVLSAGVRAFEPGIMAEAHRGILYVDEINLLDDYVVDVLLDSAAMGINTVERESVSVSHPAQFIIVGSMNPEEGELRPQLLDRIALQVEVKGIENIGDRIEIIRRRDDFNLNPQKLRERFAPNQMKLQDKLMKARELLPSVVTPNEIMDLIAKICVSFNVDGHRADIIIERAARANAAFEGRKETTVDDIIMAAEMALPHRMRKQPFEEEVFSSDLLRQVVKKFQS